MVPRANFERQLCESVLCSNLTNVSCRYKGAQLVPPVQGEQLCMESGTIGSQFRRGR